MRIFWKIIFTRRGQHRSGLIKYANISSLWVVWKKSARRNGRCEICGRVIEKSCLQRLWKQFSKSSGRACVIFEKRHCDTCGRGFLANGDTLTAGWRTVWILMTAFRFVKLRRTVIIGRNGLMKFRERERLRYFPPKSCVPAANGARDRSSRNFN